MQLVDCLENKEHKSASDKLFDLGLLNDVQLDHWQIELKNSLFY